ncbi:MAG TPA: NADPH-dependent FMN reductase, partial [Nocardioides sp.]
DFAGGPELPKRVDRAAAELAALLAVGGTPTPAPHRTLVEDEFANPTSFETLLKRASEGPPEF